MRLGLGIGASPRPLSVSFHIQTVEMGRYQLHRVVCYSAKSLEGGPDRVSVAELYKYMHLHSFINMLLCVMPVMEKYVY